jgi:hypothetical protein
MRRSLFFDGLGSLEGTLVRDDERLLLLLLGSAVACWTLDDRSHGPAGMQVGRVMAVG